MKKNTLSIAALLVFSILLVSCNLNAPIDKEVTMGKMENNVYTNDFLGMTMNIPQGYYITSEEELMEIMDLGSELLANGDEDMKKQLDLSAQQTVPLFTVYKENPYDTELIQTEYNLNASAMMEKISLLAGITVKTENDYLDAIEAQFVTMKESYGDEFNYTMGEREKVKVGGKDMVKVSGAMDLSGVAFDQEYYCYKMNEYILLITFNYDASISSQYSEIQTIVKNIKFE